MEKLYRIERMDSCVDLWKPARVILKTYKITKETQKGWWIDICGIGVNYKQGAQWVSKTGKKRFAYPTIDEAKVNFIKRTTRCVKILSSRLDTAKAFLNADLTKIHNGELTKITE